MRLTPPARLVIANRGEKEAKLKTFIVQDLADAAAGSTYTLVARAPDSPVAAALMAAAADVAAAHIAIRVVLFETDCFSEDSATTSLLECAHAEVRVLHDIRFAAAHEQLVLSGNRVWIGDCMRRDPAKRDAFEMTHVGDAKAARHTEASFAKLWAAAKPVKPVLSSTVNPAVIHAGQSADAKSGSAASRR